MKANNSAPFVAASMIWVNSENWWIQTVGMPVVLNACLPWSSARCANKFVCGNPAITTGLIVIMGDSNPEPLIISLALAENPASSPSMVALALSTPLQVK